MKKRIILTDTSCGLGEEYQNLVKIGRRVKFLNYRGDYPETEDINDSKFYRLLNIGMELEELFISPEIVQKTVQDIIDSGVEEILAIIPSETLRFKDNLTYNSVLTEMNDSIPNVTINIVECPFDGMGMSMLVDEAHCNLYRYPEIDYLARDLVDAIKEYQIIYCGLRTSLNVRNIEAMKKKNIEEKHYLPIYLQDSKRIRVIGSSRIEEEAVTKLYRILVNKCKNNYVYLGSTSSKKHINELDQQLSETLQVNRVHINKLSGVNLGESVMVAGVKTRKRLI